MFKDFKKCQSLIIIKQVFQADVFQSGAQIWATGAVSGVGVQDGM